MVLTAEQHHPNIKIFVSAHKQATFPEGNSIVPVQVGAANVKNKTEVQHRSVPVTPAAFIENSLLSIDLLSTVPTVTVIIKNAETDEVVYTSTDLNVDKVYIDLTGEGKGKYTLEIQLPKEAFTGDFELE